MAETKDYSKQKAGTKISKSMIGKIAEALGIKKGLTPGQLKLVKADINKKNVSQILKRRLGIGFGVGVLADEILPMIKSYYESTPMKTVRNQKIEYQKQFASAMGLNKSKSKNTSPPSAEAKGRKNVKTATPNSYTIKKGDSLSEISINTGISVTRLKSLNNIKNADKIKTGNRLKLK
jgi:LysM repeat protein